MNAEALWRCYSAEYACDQHAETDWGALRGRCARGMGSAIPMGIALGSDITFVLFHCHYYFYHYCHPRDDDH